MSDCSNRIFDYSMIFFSDFCYTPITIYKKIKLLHNLGYIYKRKRDAILCLHHCNQDKELGIVYGSNLM